MIPKLLISLLIFLTPCLSMAHSLSPSETKIRHYIAKQKNSQILLLKKLVNINSGTMNTPGVNRVGKIVQVQLNQLGFKTHWVYEPATMHRAGTLIAERHGTNGKRILLIGHLDTVFSKDNKFKQFKLKKHSAKGPGVTDDKGGIVVMLYALKALKAAHVLENTSITIVLTGDEEDSGKPTSISRKLLINIAKQKDVALDFEPAITLNTATISRRGVNQWTIESHGNESHSATIFQKDVGDGAIFELSRILTTMRTQLKDEKYLSFNPGIITGGTKINYNDKTSEASSFGKQNVVSKIALAKGDFRFINPEQQKSFKIKLSAIVEQHLPGTQSTIHFEEGIPAMSATENNSKLLEKYSEVSIDLNYGLVTPFDAGQRGAGDISYVASIVPANLSGLGPIGFGTHSVIESIELSSLPIQTERAAILIYRLTH